jgi:hypothetical protein
MDCLPERTRSRPQALIQLVICFYFCAALSVLAVRMAEVIPGLKSSQFGFTSRGGVHGWRSDYSRQMGQHFPIVG